MEDWPKLLYTYGPFALLVLFIFVIERKTRTALSDSGIPRRISVPVYLLNWCMIFVLCGTVTYFWFLLNLPQEAMIQGTLENLKENESVFSESGNLYLMRVYHTGPNQFGYSWRLIAPKRLREGTKQIIYLNRNDTGESRTFMYQMTVRSTFYGSPVRLVYERNNTKLLVDHEGKQEELAPTELVALQHINFTSGGLLPIAYAQASPSLDVIFERLESDDPIIRLDARRDLAAQGQSALPRIEKSLQDPKTSYRVRLGVIAALNDMKNVTVTPETRAAIVAASEAEEPVLSSEAARYLYRLPAPTCGVRCGVERWAVKSLTDEGANRINFAPERSTISRLIALQPPSVLPQDRRVSPVEFQTFEVRGLLIWYKREKSDHDFHLTIADPTDISKTMVAEIPDPQCSGLCASKQVDQISEARKRFTTRFAESEWRGVRLNPPLPITIVGVGFFDFRHHQQGMAPNGIELHPVLRIRF